MTRNDLTSIVAEDDAFATEIAAVRANQQPQISTFPLTSVADDEPAVFTVQWDQRLASDLWYLLLLDYISYKLGFGPDTNHEAFSAAIFSGPTRWVFGLVWGSKEVPEITGLEKTKQNHEDPIFLRHDNFSEFQWVPTVTPDLSVFF
ncbi:hypothetical protein N7470_004592 [Penicillium chermesinum]|nr:hypothetical protein N7470_004592 [Penicillium chermesinum]